MVGRVLKCPFCDYSTPSGVEVTEHMKPESVLLDHLTLMHPDLDPFQKPLFQREAKAP